MLVDVLLDADELWLGQEQDKVVEDPLELFRLEWLEKEPEVLLELLPGSDRLGDKKVRLR